MEYPILRYPNPTQGYVLYTDASGIGWSGVLTQEHLDKKSKAKNHPICYISGQFRGSQLNWAALTKEAYAIYMSVQRLSFYVTDAEVTIRSDHLPLRKFLNKQNMNSKVNNWAVELEQFRLHLEWIPGSQNILADSLSCLLDIAPEAQKSKELDNQEFGSYCFEELEPAKVMETISTEVIELIDDSKNLECLQKSRKLMEKEGLIIKEDTGERKTQDASSVEDYYPFFTPTANAESWAVEAFSLCVFTSTKISEWSPMERRAPAQGSSRDQCI